MGIDRPHIAARHKISPARSVPVKCGGRGRASLNYNSSAESRRIIRKEGGGGERREQLIGGRRPLASSVPVIIRKRTR